MTEQKPTMRISRPFKDWIEKQGLKGETFEDVIKRLVKEGKEK